MAATERAEDEKWIERCVELAQRGMGAVEPNPMVGCVIVARDGRVLGEGWHKKFGGPHAEVNALDSVKAEDREALAEATLYVSLEPCAHYGKTPPCAERIVGEGIGRVVVGCEDPFPKVQGGGIRILRNAGIAVSVGIGEAMCRELNRRFITYHTEKRPWVIVKWAQSADEYIDHPRGSESRPLRISTEETGQMVHELRAAEGSITVGRRTLEWDNPELTARLEGVVRQPLRIIVDKALTLGEGLKVFNDKAETLVLTEREPLPTSRGTVRYARLPEGATLAERVARAAYEAQVLSLIVEGGRETISGYMACGLWDEVRVETRDDLVIGDGVKAPELPDNAVCVKEIKVGKNKIAWYRKR